ncbi:hypothetical protein [Massilia sp. TSP1-1-2]|uniref:hypothetical protein n=1 Tax=unclassified Massilia TaxID=2609279 RepID=UPI003CF431B9
MTEQLDARLQEQLLLSRRVEGDRLVLADTVIVAALAGSRALTAKERDALRASPLTLRRFKALAQERRGAALRSWPDWKGSSGMLRAASSSAPLSAIATDDGFWMLHFVEQDGATRVILALNAAAPFAARLLREQPMLRVLDGAGAVVLQGSLDADGECESAWPFASAPAPHFQQAGAAFSVLAAP